MENRWEVKKGVGLAIGAALALTLLSATVGLVFSAVTHPPSLGTFVLFLLAVVTLGGALRVFYQLWNLLSAFYEMDRNAIIIHWGSTTHQIPMGKIQDVVSGETLSDLKIRPSLRWPGYVVGLGSSAALDDSEDADILFYATRPRAEHVIVRTGAVAYAISPADQEGFLAALHERLHMGPTQDVEESALHPAFLDWNIWRDYWALGMLLGSSGLLLLLVGAIFWRYPHLPAEIALRFTPDGAPLLIVERARVFYFAILGAIFLLLNGGLGLLFYQRERAASFFLWSGLLATLGALGIAIATTLAQQ